MTIETNYAFIDQNNKVINTAVVIKNDNEIINFLKQEYGALDAIEYDLSVPCYLNITEWTGKYWKNPHIYNSWIWNNDIGQYEPPVEYPNDGEEYVWDESLTSWLLLPPSN